MPWDDSTIADLRAQMEEHRARLTHLEEQLQEVASELDAVGVAVTQHTTTPCESQGEVATLRILVRTHSSRIAQLEERVHLLEGRGSNATG
jgi:chromosome segregation ATPase